MVGDVNLFFNDHDDPHSAEIEIMIAGKSREAFLLKHRETPPPPSLLLGDICVGVC